MDPFTSADTFQDDIRKTADLLTAGEVALYPIAAEGMAPDTALKANGKEIGEKRPSLANTAGTLGVPLTDAVAQAAK